MRGRGEGEGVARSLFAGGRSACPGSGVRPLTEQMRCRGHLGWYRPPVELASPSVCVCGCVLPYLRVWRWWHLPRLQICLEVGAE